MSKTARAAGTVGHITIAVPLHILLSIITCGLWIPVWVYMSVQRRNRRNEEKIAEKILDAQRDPGRSYTPVPPPLRETPQTPPSPRGRLT